MDSRAAGRAVLSLAEPAGDQGHVGGQLAQLVGGGVVRTGGLELAAHVDRDHLAAGGRQGLQDEQEVLFAPGIARYEQGRLPLAYPAGRERFERRELAAPAFDGQPPHPGGQLQGFWCTHRRPAYPGTLWLRLTEP